MHDSHGTISNIFGPYLTDLLLKIWEIMKNALTKGRLKKKPGLFNDIDQKGGWVSCRNHYFLKP